MNAIGSGTDRPPQRGGTALEAGEASTPLPSVRRNNDSGAQWVFLLGSDDSPAEAKVVATRDLNDALLAGWPGFEISDRILLAEIAQAHKLVEHPARRGRVVVTV